MSNSELVQLLANDYRPKEIASKAEVSIRIVERKIQLIKAQVGCKTIAAVVSKYHGMGLIQPYGTNN